jgi:hypothetical protein
MVVFVVVVALVTELIQTVGVALVMVLLLREQLSEVFTVVEQVVQVHLIL